MTDLKLKSTYITQTSSARLYGLSIPIIGLTGGIATGKSSVSSSLRERGLPVIDADKLVHKIYAEGKTINFIKSIAPSCIIDSKINFKLLRSLFFSDSSIKKSVETFIYKELPNAFSGDLSNFKSPNFVIYDVPLLFEKNLNTVIDLSVTVYCDKDEQLKRLIQRDQIDTQLADKILSAQLPTSNKRDLADYIIDNNGTFSDLKAQIDVFINQIFE